MAVKMMTTLVKVACHENGIDAMYCMWWGQKQKSNKGSHYDDKRKYTFHKILREHEFGKEAKYSLFKIMIKKITGIRWNIKLGHLLLDKLMQGFWRELNWMLSGGSEALETMGVL